MRIATVSLAAKLSPAFPLAIALSVFALASPVFAQDVTQAEIATPVAKPSDASSDRQQRRERRKTAAAAKPAEGDAAEKSTTLAKFPKAEEANAAAAKPKMECRKQVVTGSRLGKMICGTPEQWAQTDARAAEAARQMRNEISDRSRIASPGSIPLGGASGR